MLMTLWDVFQQPGILETLWSRPAHLQGCTGSHCLRKSQGGFSAGVSSLKSGPKDVLEMSSEFNLLMALDAGP